MGFDWENTMFGWDIATATIVSDTQINYTRGNQSLPGFSGGPILNTSGEVVGIQKGVHDAGLIRQAFGDVVNQQILDYALQYLKFEDRPTESNGKETRPTLPP
jgi:hypothetical protein